MDKLTEAVYIYIVGSDPMLKSYMFHSEQVKILSGRADNEENDDCVDQLAELLRAKFFDVTPRASGQYPENFNGLIKTVFHAALDEVNWLEIAQKLCQGDFLKSLLG